MSGASKIVSLCSQSSQNQYSSWENHMFMRNKRTGRIVVYDEKLLELGYELVVDEPKPKKPMDDEISMQDEITIKLYKEAA